MRITILVILLFVVVGMLAYSLMPDDTASESSQAMRLHSEATSAVEIQRRLDELVSALQRYQQLDQDQWNRAQSQQARLQKMLADFDRRLRTVEAADAARTSGTAMSGVAQSAGNTEMVSIDAETVDSEAVSEVDLGHRMDELLRAGYSKQDSTELATEQVLKSLEKTPDVILEAMQCGDSFCRATFAQENGEHPAIDELFGGPPFEGESFTLQDADGRVTLYFTLSGGSLEEFRSEARQAKQAESWQ